MTGKQKAHRRKLRIALIGGLAFVLLLALAWQSYWARHKMLRVVTQVEGAAYFTLGDADHNGNCDPYLHRAGWPPNSSAGLAAISAGASIEIDVCFTSDFVPYLSHGDDFKGATPRHLDFQTLSADQVNGMERTDGEPYLRLTDFLDRYAERFNGVILDVKTDHADAGAKADVLASVVDGDSVKFTVTSLSGRFLWELHDRAPRLRLGCESFGPLASWLAGFDGFHAKLTDVTDSRNRAAVSLGLRRLYYVVESPEDRRRVVELAPEACIVKAPADSDQSGGRSE